MEDESGDQRQARHFCELVANQDRSQRVDANVLQGETDIHIVRSCKAQCLGHGFSNHA